MQALSSDEIQSALEGLPGWQFQDDQLSKSFEFQNFREAISFIVRLSFEAETLNHHPELSNVYNKVTLNLRTHDAGNKVTANDISLAKAIETFNWVNQA